MMFQEYVCVHGNRPRTFDRLRHRPRTKRRRRVWAAPAAGMRIGSPHRSACGHGFAGSGVASQIITVPSGSPTSQWPSGLNARLLISPPALRLKSSWPVCASHTFTALVQRALLARRWPSGLKARKPSIVPIPGTTKRHRLEENLAAASVELTADDLREIEAVASQFTVQGARYPEHLEQMADRWRVEGG